MTLQEQWDRQCKRLSYFYYRKYTEAILRRYERLSSDCSRPQSVLNREVFLGDPAEPMNSIWMDCVIFCVEIEKILDSFSVDRRKLIVYVSIMGYSHSQAASMLKIGLRKCVRDYAYCIDCITEQLVNKNLLVL